MCTTPKPQQQQQQNTQQHCCNISLATCSALLTASFKVLVLKMVNWLFNETSWKEGSSGALFFYLFKLEIKHENMNAAMKIL